MKKLMNKKAFTIMEMLIVVAIIAVLVAIAIPTFSSALTKAKEAADVANVRAAYAEMQVDVMVNGKTIDTNAISATKTKSTPSSTTAPVKITDYLESDLQEATVAWSYADGTGTITCAVEKLNNGTDYTWTVENINTTTTGNQQANPGQ